MSENDPIKEAVARHERIIGGLQEDMYRVGARMTVIEDRQDRLLQISSRIESKLDHINDETQDIKAWMNQSKGGLRLGKWIAGIGLTVLGLGLAFIKYFKGGG